MNKKKIFAFLILFALPLLASAFYFPVSSKNNNVLITEIAAFEDRGCEWVEIYNRGDKKINIGEWRFWEDKTNHTIDTDDSHTTSTIIQPNEYALIADDPNKILAPTSTQECKDTYQISTTTPVLDSTFSLNQTDGEEIALKKSSSFLDTVEKFKYPGTDRHVSLERISIKKLNYTKDNWKFLISTSTPTSTPGKENYHCQGSCKASSMQKFNPKMKIVNSSSIAKGVEFLSSVSSSKASEFEWAFTSDDEIQKKGSSTTYAFSEPGKYSINLLGYNTEGAVSTIKDEIKITRKPEAKLDAPTSSKVNTDITFSAASSSHPSEVPIKKYLWRFGEESIIDTNKPTTTYHYNSTGSYKISLKIKDKNRGVDSTSTTIDILPNENTKSASSNTTSNNNITNSSSFNIEILASSTAFTNEKTKFNSKVTTNTNITYSWSVTPQKNINQPNKNSSSATYAFPSSTTYTVKLKGTANNTSSTASHKIDVQEQKSQNIRTSSDKIKINEIMPDPDSGSEWIELYNPENSKINLSDWSLFDNVGKITTLDTNISAAGFYTYTLNDAKLNNSGDKVLLKNKNNKIIDQISYGNNNVPKTETGNSIARNQGGQDSNNHQNDFSETTKPTKNKGNEISKPQNQTQENSNTSENESSNTSNEVDENEENDSNESNQNQPNQEGDSSQNSIAKTFNKSDLLINEILPDPKNRNEFIEIYNNTKKKISLTGWKIEDGSSNQIDLEGNIKASKLHLSEEESSYINNGGDLIKLVSPKDKNIDKIIFGEWKTDEKNIAPAPKTGKSLARVNHKDSDNYKQDFAIQTSTPGKKNLNIKINKKNKKPNKQITEPISIKGPKKVPTDKTVKFTASLSDKFKVSNLIWQVNMDKVAQSTKSISQNFSEPGIYTLIARIIKNNKEKANAATQIRVKKNIDLKQDQKNQISSQENKKQNGNPNKKSISNNKNNSNKTRVGGYIPTSKQTKIQINEILPNPKGEDTKEFIELYNPTTKPISLQGIKLDDAPGGSNPYHISTTTAVKPKSYAVFPKKKTGIALNNSSDAVRLLNSSGKVISKIGYQNAAEAESFDGKTWSKIQTPGFKNKIIANKSSKRSTEQTSGKTGYRKVALKNIRNFEEGDKVITRGVVISKPQALGPRIFYIQGSPGLQVYNHDKNFPNLKRGDKVEVRGELSKAYGKWRLITENKYSIRTIDHTGVPSPKVVQAKNLNNKDPSQLIQLQGEVSKIEDDNFLLYSRKGEARVQIEQETGIDIDKYKKRDLVKVTGILSKEDGKAIIMPRDQKDIEKTGRAEKPKKKSKSEAQINKRESQIEKYLIAAAGAIIVILTTLLLKEKNKN